MSTPELHTPTHPVRFVTASALFDGHDASINIMRRIMQSQGAEVIHLGHNRAVQEVVEAAIEELLAARRVISVRLAGTEHIAAVEDAPMGSMYGLAPRSIPTVRTTAEENARKVVRLSRPKGKAGQRKRKR